MVSLRPHLLVTISLALASAAPAASDFIWVEGEDAVRHTMQPHGWYDSVKKENLSGKEWLSHFAGGTPPVADFEIRVSEPGDYHFWIRANSVAAPRLSYKLGGADWIEVDLRQSVENINIASDGKPDMRFISWINAGQLHLAEGTQRIAFKFLSANNNHGALDCFVLTRSPFMPRGALKPGQRTSKANPGLFAWEPDVDAFTDDAVIDLRHLNEDVAGRTGRVAAKGNHFVLGDGTPVKFWAANIGGAIHRLDHQSHIYLAKHLAKRGVNLVRIHGGIYSSRDPAVDKQKIDNLHHFVRALKQEGIYTKLSFYFPAWFRLDPWHKQGDRWSFMLLFFDPDMQRIYFRWADALLKTPNPYTGVPLGKDPAVAIVEIQNEDSHFFWTFDKKNAPPERWETLRQLYGSWLKRRYGSLEKALAAWGGARVEGDDPADGKMELLSAWNMTRAGLEGAPRRRKRVSDQVRFLTENMRGFYARAIGYFDAECGYDGLVSCGNWRTADASVLGPLEQYCYTAGDVIDHHGYFDHNHKGDGANWSVRPGHTFSSQSALSLRDANPLPYVEVDGHPNIISEIGWPMPNMYRAEWPFLTAAYGCLNGLDAICHFSLRGAGWDQSVSKFPMSTPTALGSFFATALIYRQQHVQEGASVVSEHLAIEDLLALKGSNVFVRPALDQLRADQVPSGQTGRIEEAIDPATFYAGRVTRSFDGRPEQSRVGDIRQFIDRQGKTIASATGEVRLDYGAQVVTIDTPKAQGAAGFLGRESTIRLGDTDIQMANDYGTVLVVALDNRPLARSKEILIQCMTIDQLYGWETSEPGGMAGTIRSVGSAPWGVQKIDAAVTLRLPGGKPTQVIACDENGYATDKVTSVSSGADAITIDINETTRYTVVMR
jgi:hypothetical protein